MTWSNNGIKECKGERVTVRPVFKARNLLLRLEEGKQRAVKLSKRVGECDGVASNVKDWLCPIPSTYAVCRLAGGGSFDG